MNILKYLILAVLSVPYRKGTSNALCHYDHVINVQYTHCCESLPVLLYIVFLGFLVNYLCLKLVSRRDCAKSLFVCHPWRIGIISTYWYSISSVSVVDPDPGLDP
jgi:hypothetical protein